MIKSAQECIASQAPVTIGSRIQSWPPRIEICGGIASGKTTLARLLARRTGWTLVTENFRRNPFWAKFYADPGRFAHEKNLTFLSMHTGAIKSHVDAQAVVCDYAVFQDLAYARLSRSPKHILAMQAAYRDLYGATGAARLLIHLDCEPRVLLERIRARGRREESSITVAYLRSLNTMIKATLAKHNCGAPIMVIRADRVDFAHDREQAARIKSEILAKIDAQNP